MTFTIDMVGITITAVITVLGFLLARTLNKIDRNQELLFEKLDKINERLSTLEGEHRSMQTQCQKAIETFSHNLIERDMT